MVRKYSIAQLRDPLVVDQTGTAPPVDATAEGDIFSNDPALTGTIAVLAGNITGGFVLIARNNDAACAGAAGVVATRLALVYLRISATVAFDVEIGYANNIGNVCSPGLRTLDRGLSRNSIVTDFQSNGGVPNLLAKFLGFAAGAVFEWPLTAPAFTRDAPGSLNGLQVGARGVGPFTVTHSMLYRQTPTP